MESMQGFAVDEWENSGEYRILLVLLSGLQVTRGQILDFGSNFNSG